MRKSITKSKKRRGNTIKLVVKSNELVEARYMFDVWETRFFHSLIASIDRKDEDDKVYRLWFKDIKKNFQLKSNQSYSYLREAAISMASKSVYIGWMNDKHRRGRMHRIIRFVDFLEKGQKGEGAKQQEYVDVSIDKDIKPYLLDIKKNFDPKLTRYTSYDLRNIIKLKPYSTRIYELLKQFEYKGFRTIVIEDLKEMFEIKDEYPRFSNFYQKVIITSIDAINKNTDLRIPKDKIEKIKRGRKVYALRFMIMSKSDEEVSIMRNEFVPKTLFDNIEEAEIVEEKLSEADKLFEEFQAIVVKQFGVTPTTFVKMLSSKKYSKKDIEQAINVTRRANYNQMIKSNIAGFFIKALKEGYTDTKEEAKKSRGAAVSSKKAEPNPKKIELQELEKKLRAELIEKENAIIQALFIEQPSLQEVIFEELKTSRVAGYDSDKTEEENMMDPQFAGAFRNSARKRFVERFEALDNQYVPRLKKIKNGITSL